MSKSFIYPIDVQYPHTMNVEDIKCYSLTEIARAKVNGQENALDQRGRKPNDSSTSSAVSSLQY